MKKINKPIRGATWLLFALLALCMASVSPAVYAQSAGSNYGDMTIGANPSYVTGNIINKSTGRIFFGANSPGQMTNKLVLTGNYSGENGAKIYLTATNASTHGYFQISGTATGSTKVMLDLNPEWDGSRIDLIESAKTSSSTTTAFTMDNTLATTSGKTAFLRWEDTGTKIIWYIMLQETIIAAVDDYVAIWECESTTIDVLTNDSYEGTVSITLPYPNGDFGSASLTGNKVSYTHNCASGGAGQTDVIPYKICDTYNNCSEANICITLMKKPAILLLDSCSVEPKLVPDLQYSGATYVWQRLNTGSGQWENLAGPTTNVTLPITEAGTYRVQVTLNEKTITTAEIKIALIKQATLPGGEIFYQMQVSH